MVWRPIMAGASRQRFRRSCRKNPQGESSSSCNPLVAPTTRDPFSPNRRTVSVSSMIDQPPQVDDTDINQGEIPFPLVSQVLPQRNSPQRRRHCRRWLLSLGRPRPHASVAPLPLPSVLEHRAPNKELLPHVNQHRMRALKTIDVRPTAVTASGQAMA